LDAVQVHFPEIRATHQNPNFWALERVFNASLYRSGNCNSWLRHSLFRLAK